VVQTFGESDPDARGLRVAIIVSMFNDQITRKLRDGAIETATKLGVAEEDIEVYWVPGAFELPLVAQRLAETGDYDAIAALGCVIKGDTPHDVYVATETARGIMDVSREYGLPVAFGVITTLNLAQAEARAGGEVGNKGSEAIYAALHAAAVLRVIDDRESATEA
jgi:6,7-dimethyl-8-ribityllumazine synthase